MKKNLSAVEIMKIDFGMKKNYTDIEKKEIDREFFEDYLKIGACPSCKGDIELKDNKIVCKKCGLKYPIRDGLPIMMIEEAEK